MGGPSGREVLWPDQQHRTLEPADNALEFSTDRDVRLRWTEPRTDDHEVLTRGFFEEASRRILVVVDPDRC